MKNIYKIILGIIGTGTVATTGVLVTNNVINDKEKNMTNISNDIIIQETSNENTIEKQNEETIEGNNQPQESFPDSNNTTITNVNTEKSSLEGTTHGGIYYMTQEEIDASKEEDARADESIKSLKKPGKREDSTQPTAEPGLETTQEAEDTEVVE